MDFPHGETVTVVTTTTTDATGLGDTSTATAEVEWGPCAVWDRFAEERTDPQAAPVIVGLSIAGPRIAINSDDTILRDGVTYEVDGPPQLHTVSPFTGWDPGIVVNVKRAGSA